MSRLLTVESDENSVKIHLNNEGIDFLVSELNSLKKNNVSDHSHFMTTDLGGNELTNIKQSDDDKTTLIHHLKLYF